MQALDSRYDLLIQQPNPFPTDVLFQNNLRKRRHLN
jgi:hypothetical protein